MKLIGFYLFLFISLTLSAQNNTIPAQRDSSDFLGRIIFSQYCDSFPEIYSFPEWYQLQLIYIQIDRDENQKPHFTVHKHRVNDQQYFYPASLVKWPTLLLTLEWLNSYQAKYRVDKYSPIELLKTQKCQTDFKEDTSGLEDYPCVANFIRKILIASDNQSFNALFDILGQDYINQKLRDKGYNRPVIIRNFSGCSDESFRFTRAVNFYNNDHQRILSLPPREMKKNWVPNCSNMKVGKAYYSGGKKIDSPMDFSYNNYLPLEDVVEMFLTFLFPENYPKNKQWQLSYSDRLFLLQYLSVYPRHSPINQYHNYSKYEDSFKKYFMYAETKDSITDSNLKIFNIVGMSYGFASDIAYIVDLKNNVEFVVAGVIYVNQDEVLGDDKYEYRPLAWQFYSRLGRILYRYEVKRKKAFPPDFKEIKEALSMPFL